MHIKSWTMLSISVYLVLAEVEQKQVILNKTSIEIRVPMPLFCTNHFLTT